MLINIIHKDSLPDSTSTTYHMWASLSDILFSSSLEKYIVCDVCGLRSPSFEPSSVLYISLTDTSSMQNLILQGLQHKLQKSCSRCNKNTWHGESSYILQPPKYLRLFVNRFRYINNWLYLHYLNIPNFFMYSCTNIFQRRSLCTFFKSKQRLMAKEITVVKLLPICQ